MERARREFEDYLESYQAEEGEAGDDPEWWLGFIFWIQGKFRDDVAALGSELMAGDIDLDEWRAAMRERIETLHVVCAVAGTMGDWDAVNWEAVEERVREQYEYLEGFREDIEERQGEEGGLTPWVIARAGLYAGSLLAMYHIIRREEERRAGRNEVLWVVDPSVENCEDCQELAGRGWMPIDDLGGQVPGDGQTACMGNCHCHLEYRTVASQQSQLEATSMDIVVMSEPAHGQLSIGGLAVDAVKRRELREALEAGELGELSFDAVVWKDGPNANFFRFREEDLVGFGESYRGQPFLRNHDIYDIGSRDGMVAASMFDGQGFLQTIELTTQRGLRSFVEGQIDRFSIGWYYDGITCSICGGDWMGPGCVHWPGRTYTDGEGKNSRVCELIFENPRGKETSAVNAPAVDGTRILARLCEQKRGLGAKQEVEDMEEREVEAVVEETPLAVEPAPVVEPVVVERPVEPAPVVEPVVVERPVEPAPVVDDGWASYFRDRAMEIALGGSGLPPSMQENIRQQMDGHEVTPAGLERSIEQHRVILAALQQDEVVTGMGRPLDGGVVVSVRAPMEAMSNAVDWVFGVPGAKLPPPELRQVDRLYHILTGDFDWHGVFRSDQAQLAAADSTTLTGLAASAMNKVIVGLWDGVMMYRWFEPLVAVQPHDGSTHDMQWIQFGGVSNLSEISEGGVYTEKTVADSKEADSFQKYGNYVGITIEMIRKSQIAKMRAVTQALVVAAVRTRSAAIASIFTTEDGVGPTLDQDSVALFHTVSHGNLATTSFSWSAWKAARLECAKQTELGSSKRQGLWPAYCLVPFDLYDDALVIFGYGAGPQGKPGTSDYDVNPFAQNRPGDPRPKVVPVPDWTDAYKWAYLADPLLAPVIQMSYAQSPGGGEHPGPELFSVTSPNSGLMFSNDVMPIKIRDWWAYGVATHRGIGKRNATS